MATNHHDKSRRDINMHKLMFKQHVINQTDARVLEFNKTQMVQDSSLAQTQLVHGSLKPISEGKPDFTAGTQNLSQSYASAVGTDDKIYLVKPPGVEFKKINYKNGRIELEKLALNPNTDRGSDFAIKSAHKKSNADSQDLILSP